MAFERRGIHYWKCDRMESFHGTHDQGKRDTSSILQVVEAHLAETFNKPVSLSPAAAQGNHVTAIAQLGNERWFVRIEDGPEGDAYMEAETRLLNELTGHGIPVPRVAYCEASREAIPYAVQVLEFIAKPTLNDQVKSGTLQPHEAATMIGTWVARWQAICPAGFGPLNIAAIRQSNALVGLHHEYGSYFLLNLPRHLKFLVESTFLSKSEAERLGEAVGNNLALLNLEKPCLVHKDLAFWNILGTSSEVSAFIDWDDAIGGDPMDDLSLLACFYEPKVVRMALQGYAAERPLPGDYLPRFWLHWLRNMVVKAVVRQGAGYFTNEGNLFLMESGQDGASLRQSTRHRLFEALRALETNREILDYDC